MSSTVDTNDDALADKPWRQYICVACGLIYDEREGDPDGGLAPGTRFADIPDDWECPVCGVTKKDFKPFVKRERDAKAPSLVPIKGEGIVIVGGGMAGWAMAEAIRERDSEVPVIMITACTGDRYNKPQLSVSFAKASGRQALVRESAMEESQRLGVTVINHTFVVSVSASLRQIRTTRGTFKYKKLVIAQGSQTRMPAELPENLCWRINVLDDWCTILPKLQDAPKRIAIVGAGMVGCEIAEDLSRMGHEVYLLSRNRFPLESLLPEIAGARLKSAQTDLGIKFISSKTIEQVVENSDSSKSILFSEQDTKQFDEIIATTGVSTDSRIANRAQLEFENGILVDPDTMQTSQQHIYAVGDCASFSGQCYRYIGLIDQQVSVVADTLVSKSSAGTYQNNKMPPVVLKTKSCPVEINGTPDVTGDWEVVKKSPDYLFLTQMRNGKVGATISVGKSR